MKTILTTLTIALTVLSPLGYGGGMGGMGGGGMGGGSMGGGGMSRGGMAEEEGA